MLSSRTEVSVLWIINYFSITRRCAAYIQGVSDYFAPTDKLDNLVIWAWNTSKFRIPVRSNLCYC